MNIRQTIQRYPIVIYFGLAYAIAWGGILAGENFLFSAIFAVVLWMVVAVVVATTGPRLVRGSRQALAPV